MATEYRYRYELVREINPINFVTRLQQLGAAGFYCVGNMIVLPTYLVHGQEELYLQLMTKATAIEIEDPKLSVQE